MVSKEKIDKVKITYQHKTEASVTQDSNWAISYADLVTNLLCMFIMLFAISSIDKRKYEVMAKGIRKNLKVRVSQNIKTVSMDQVLIPLPITQEHPVKTKEELQKEIDALVKKEGLQGVSIKIVAQPKAESLKELEKMLTTFISGNKGFLKDVQMVVDADKIRIVFPNERFFSLGAVEPKKESVEAITKFAKMIEPLKDSVRVYIEGHTDSMPVIRSKHNRYTSNWELSVLRATNVLRIFIDGGLPPSNLVAQGYGDTMPVAPNTDANGKYIEENLGKNRRIVLQFEVKETPVKAPASGGLLR